MKETKLRHLQKRLGVYRFRRKIPLDLQIHYAGKVELSFSLETKDRKEAEPLVRKWGVFYDDEFAMLRKGAPEGLKVSIQPSAQSPTSQPKLTDGLGIDDVNVLAARHLVRLRSQREKAASDKRALSTFYSAINNDVYFGKDYLETGEHEYHEPPKPMWQYEAFIKAAEALIGLKDLPYVDPQRVSPLHPTSTLDKSPIVETYLADIVDKWALEQTPDIRTIHHTKRILLKFDELAGKMPIRKITKLDIVGFKDKLRESGYTIPNTNQYLSIVRVILNFAVKQGVIDNNVSNGVSIKDNRAAKELRISFDTQSLVKIFSSPIYTSGERPIGGRGEASYWLPLLAIFTGARLNELCQLTVDDIYIEQYQDSSDLKVNAWVIHIRDDAEGQRLKTSGSRRRVPVHSVLIELGFIKYIKSIQSGRIFPLLKPDNSFGSISSNWSKWFGKRLRDTLNIQDKRMVFHSFRHTFKDYARNAGIATEIHDAITGHSSGNVSGNYGADNYPLRPLVEAMDKYKITGLTFPLTAPSRLARTERYAYVDEVNPVS